MIEAIDLKKSFGAVQAVRGVSFVVSRGEAVGFLGPNGAGKTTTFRMLAGTIGPTEGRVRLGGKDLHESPIEAKRLLGYMAENAPLYPELTGREYLEYRAELKGIPRKSRKTAIEKAAQSVLALDMLGTRIAHLSKGYRQRMALADALVGDPPILLLDEPTSGLDPNQVLEIRRLIRKLAKDHAIMLSTHILSEVEATCSRAIVVHQGRVVAEGSLTELQARRNICQAQIVVRGETEIALELVSDLLQTKPEVVTRSEDTLTLLFPLDDPDHLARLIEACVQRGIQVLEAAPRRPALDDVFAELTQTDSPDAP